MALAANIERGSDYRLGAAALFLAGAAIVTALGFQYIGGYQPCMLCLMQRYAYYAGIPILFVALALTAGGSRGFAAALFFLVALAFLANAGLGFYHAGAEWKFWPGPTTSRLCSAMRQRCASLGCLSPAGMSSRRSS